MSPCASYCHYSSISEAVVIILDLPTCPFPMNYQKTCVWLALSEHLMKQRMSSLSSRRDRLQWGKCSKGYKTSGWDPGKASWRRWHSNWVLKGRETLKRQGWGWRQGLGCEEEVGQTLQACLICHSGVPSRAGSGQGKKVGCVYFVKTSRCSDLSPVLSRKGLWAGAECEGRVKEAGGKKAVWAESELSLQWQALGEPMKRDQVRAGLKEDSSDKQAESRDTHVLE